MTSAATRDRSTARDRALVDHLAATIQARVLSGQIPSGARLKQESLASEFGVSRTPVREALRKLQATGIVEVEPNRGALVRGPTAREIREAYEVRAELEGLAAELAARHIADAQLRRLRKAERIFRHSIRTLLQQRKRAPESELPWEDDTEWVRANDLFHQVVQEASGNARLVATIADLHQTFPRSLTWSALSASSRLLEENVDQHHAILEAIERHDPAGARRLMTDHVNRAGDLVARRFERARDSPS